MWRAYDFAISPDGKKQVFVDENNEGKNQLFLQAMDTFAATADPLGEGGTDGGRLAP
jgi:hypothetical protein